MKAELMKMFEDKDENPEKIECAVKACYPAFGEIINKQKYTISSIINDWPLMFTPLGLKFHYKMLMDENLESLTSVIAITYTTNSQIYATRTVQE